MGDVVPRHRAGRGLRRCERSRPPTRTESSIQQLRGFEDTLATFLAECSADTDCAFHNDGDAEGAFDDLMAGLDEEPIPGLPDRPDVNRRVALRRRPGDVQQVYWPALEESLADAAGGDGSGLLSLVRQLLPAQPDGTWGNELEAFQAIDCMDTTERLTVAEDDALSADYTAAAPRLAPAGSSAATRARSSRPRSIRASTITGAGAGPIVVVGTTGDPATPLTGTRAMADVARGRVLVVVEADQHTGYSVNSCINDVVNDYLVDLAPPSNDTECR